jgi:hypothetical protein
LVEKLPDGDAAQQRKNRNKALNNANSATPLNESGNKTGMSCCVIIALCDVIHIN